MIEAVQWFKDGDHPAVKSRAPRIIFDQLKNYFYVSRFDQKEPIASMWLAVDPTGETARAYGEVLPFAFYDLKSGDIAPLAEHAELAAAYARAAKWTSDPVAMGIIRTLEGDHLVTPGDWIITGIQGEHYPCKPDIFAATYEAAD